MADPTQMQQILMNLCTNAAHAMENDGGKLQQSSSKSIRSEKKRPASNRTLAQESMSSFRSATPGMAWRQAH